MINKKKICLLNAALLLSLLLTGRPISAKAEDNSNDLEFNVEIIDNPLFADDLCKIMQGLPSGIREYLALNKLNVVLLEDSSGAEYTWQKLYGYSIGSIRGFTYVQNYGVTIYVESSMHPGYYEKYANISNDFTEEDFNYRLSRDTLFHELGHFFDTIVDFELSGSDEFNQIYLTELSNYYDTIQYKVDNLGVYANVSSPVEYFASAYACYISYPEDLQEKCPLTYNYIDNYMQMINKQYSPVEFSNIPKTLKKIKEEIK